MRAELKFVCVLAVQAALSCGLAAAQTCADPASGLGVTRIVEIDTSTGPLYGDMSKYVREDTFLGPKEIVLTFDDGPLPWITKSILDTLDQYCTKATFFSVGQMALAYPEYPKEVLARGHTLGSHTWSHPMNLSRLSFEKAKDQIERGQAAVALAAGQPIAPFFRFPGLNDSDPLLQYLQTRGMASFTVDVVSNDSFIASSSRLVQITIAQVEQRKGGILLFHDIKASTAHALPDILKELKTRGYKVVHMKAKTAATPIASYEAELAPILAKTVARASAAAREKAGSKSKAGGEEVAHQLRPLDGLGAPQKQVDLAGVTVVELTAPARARLAAVALVPEARSAAQLRRAKRAAAAQKVESDDLDRAIKPTRQKVRYKQPKKAANPSSPPNFFQF